MSNNPFKLEVKLKQHTPLIHFQSEQVGATLRATEVKPKLDRFLIEKKTKIFNDYEKAKKVFKEKYAHFLVGGGKSEHVALDYKMKIIISSESSIEDPTKNPLYFGNMGNDKKRYIRSQSLLTIHSRKTELIKNIDKDNILHFFALNNFGNRQSKGVGCYLPEKINEQGIKIEDIEKCFPTQTAYLEISNTSDDTIFRVIDYYWKRLKSGINYSYNKNTRNCDREKYKKSFLYTYMQEHMSGITWEKKWVKENFFDVGRDPKNDEKFARALLGLAGSFSYAVTNEKCNPGKSLYIPFKTELSISNDSIKRIKAPILFKPIKIEPNKTRIYILFDSDYQQQDLLGNAFKVDVNFYEAYINVEGKDKKIKKRIKVNNERIENQKWYQDAIQLDDNKEVLEEIKDWYNQLQSKNKSIATPSMSIDMKKMIQEYHKHLGNNFIARDFKWNNIANVSIKYT